MYLIYVIRKKKEEGFLSMRGRLLKLLIEWNIFHETLHPKNAR